MLIDRELYKFNEALYNRVNKKYLSIYFHELKIRLNTISLVELQNIKKVKELDIFIPYSSRFQKEKLLYIFEYGLNYQIAELSKKKESKLRPTIDTTYLNAIKIKEYFSIKDMEIDDLAGHKEIYFVGENGDGKTVLLQAIVLALKGDEYDILAEDYIKGIKKEMVLSTKDSVYPNEYKTYKKVQNIFAYGINRNKISSDEKETEFTSYSGLFDTPSIYKTTLLRDAEKFLEQENISLIEDFKEKMSFLMDKKFQIIKTEKGLKYGEIEDFSMLSEGYKTTLIWLCDLLSRMMENQSNITELKDFQAIVLIDEVDLYLHPKWKYEFMYKLRQIFKGIQFIMTTHSLVTVLGAGDDAVFYKVYKEGGVTKVSPQINDISTYTANILMTSPMFNLDSMSVRNFNKNERLSSDDYIYREIHLAIREEMKNNPNVIDEKLKEKVRDELKKRLARLKK